MNCRDSSFDEVDLEISSSSLVGVHLVQPVLRGNLVQESNDDILGEMMAVVVGKYRVW